jgi:hypothetical protein
MSDPEELDMPNDDIQHLIIAQLRDVSSTSTHLAERVAGLEVKVSVIDTKLDSMNAKMDKIFERDDARISTLETFKWQANGVLAAIILIWAPLLAAIGWWYRGVGPITAAVARTTGITLPF